jgi:hypothetical protein
MNCLKDNDGEWGRKTAHYVLRLFVVSLFLVGWVVVGCEGGLLLLFAHSVKVVRTSELS